MWRETTKHERNLAIWRDELDEFVPDRVLDFHVHVFNEASVPAGQAFDCGGHPIRQYPFDDLSTDLAELYPGRETSAVCFGIPFVDYDKAVKFRTLFANHPVKCRFARHNVIHESDRLNCAGNNHNPAKYGYILGTCVT